MMKRKNLMISLADMELQAAEGDEWRIKGYATKFGNTNSYGFEIAAGAYDAVLKAGVKPKMFFNHDAWSVPIGLWDRLEADEKGLRVEGVLTKGVSQAGDVYAALKAGTVDGLSVGISFNEEDAALVGKRIILKNIRELREISVVTNPTVWHASRACFRPMRWTSGLKGSRRYATRRIFCAKPSVSPSGSRDGCFQRSRQAWPQILVGMTSWKLRKSCRQFFLESHTLRSTNDD